MTIAEIELVEQLTVAKIELENVYDESGSEG